MTFANQGRTFERNKRKWTQQEREEALYLFYIGTQDYLNYTLTHSDPSFFDQENFINNVVLEIEQVLKVSNLTHMNPFMCVYTSRSVNDDLGFQCRPYIEEEGGSLPSRIWHPWVAYQWQINYLKVTMNVLNYPQSWRHCTI